VLDSSCHATNLNSTRRQKYDELISENINVISESVPHFTARFFLCLLDVYCSVPYSFCGTKKRRKNSPYHSSLFLHSHKQHMHQDHLKGYRIRCPVLFITMIRKNALTCKLILIKSSATSLFHRFINSFLPERESCPYCGAAGTCSSFGSYDRYIIDFVAGRSTEVSVKVPRVRCSGCGCTHAILPDVLVPYRSYSLFFMLHVIGEYLAHIRTVEQTCLRFGITVSMFYRWLRVFKAHKEEWLGALKSFETEDTTLFYDLTHCDPFSAFSKEFYHRTLLSFLQSHRNPANCRYQPGKHP